MAKLLLKRYILLVVGNLKSNGYFFKLRHPVEKHIEIVEIVNFNWQAVFSQKKTLGMLIHFSDVALR